MVGGGWRQAGFLAAAGLYALENNIKGLEFDHAHAASLAKSLSEIDELSIDQPLERTNMVWITLSKRYLPELAQNLRDKGILISLDDYPLRLVTHLDVNDNDIKKTVDAFKHFFFHS